MNLKDMKKVHEDDKIAVFRNPKGHEFRVAKAGLKKDHLDALKKLPIHASDSNDDEPIPASTNDAPAWGPDDANASDAQSGAPVAMGAGVTPPPHNFLDPEAQRQDAPIEKIGAFLNKNLNPEYDRQNPNPEKPGDAQAQNQGQLAQVNANEPLDLPSDNVAADSSEQPQSQSPERAAASQPLPPPTTAAEHLNNLQSERLNVQQDLAAGRITPKTYQSMFNDQKLPGKIGTLFGLLVSGAGSGLAHQSNAVMDMMNKEIDNDLKAQQQNKEGGLNFWKAAQADELNKANIKHLGAETELTHQNANIAAITAARSNMELSLLHGLGLGASKLPDNSPTKGRYIQTLNGVSQAQDQQALQRETHAAAQMGMISEADYVARNNKLRQAGAVMEKPGYTALAENYEKKMIPGLGYADRDVPQEKIDRLNKITNYQYRLDQYRQLADKISSGFTMDKWSPKLRQQADQIKSDLVSGYNDVKGLNRFTSNEEGLYDKIIPDIKKMDMVNFFGGAKQNIGNLQSSIQRVKEQEFGQAKVHPFSDATGFAVPSQGQNQGQPEIQTMGGIPHMKVQGGWRKIKQ